MLLSHPGCFKYMEPTIPQNSELRIPSLKINVWFRVHISRLLLWQLNEDQCPWHLHAALNWQDKPLSYELKYTLKEDVSS